MSNHFRQGEFARHKVVGPLRSFCPIQSELRIEEINLEGLHNRGKKLILLDVDNTLTLWRSEEISAEVLGWIARARELGFGLCIISNTRHPARLQRLSEMLNVPALRGRFKPSRKMFFEALKRFNCPPENAIMIEDQLMTDILGANRSGIEAIWLQPLGQKEFSGTRVNRWLERRIVSVLYNAMSLPADAAGDAPELEAKKPILQRTIVKQLVKFLIVGGSSFVIDTACSIVLINFITIHKEHLGLILGNWMLSAMPFWSHYADGDPGKVGSLPLLVIAALAGMFNSFVFNRRWTFEVKGSHKKGEQLRKFYLISIVGALLNSLLTNEFLVLFGRSSSKTTLVAKFLAAVVVAVWNFGGQRLYAFKPATTQE